jgi:hypothetical protein
VRLAIEELSERRVVRSIARYLSVGRSYSDNEWPWAGGSLLVSCFALGLRCCELPPADRFADAGLDLADPPRRASHVTSAVAAEVPEVPRRLLLLVRKSVELEDVEIARVEPHQRRPKVIDQATQRALVICAHTSYAGGPAFLSRHTAYARNTTRVRPGCCFQKARTVVAEAASCVLLRLVEVDPKVVEIAALWEVLELSQNLVQRRENVTEIGATQLS